ncbi:uncharacterized protein PAE49_009435 [Odontesthes bonariensis]
MMVTAVLMMVVMACVSAGPLPALPEHSRRDEVDLLGDNLTNATSFPVQFDQNVNNSSNFTRDFGQRQDQNITAAIFISRADAGPCRLGTCALVNLGHDLQSGGDETAGQSSSDPFGPGK